jgi:lactoylglutathione lyase
MGHQLTSITISTGQLPHMLAFYQALGLVFQVTNVDKGSEMHKAKGVVPDFVLYSAASSEQASKPSIQLGFKVSHLDQKFAELKRLSGVHCILDPSAVPGGRKAIVLDPDGHAVELFEAA